MKTREQNEVTRNASGISPPSANQELRSTTSELMDLEYRDAVNLDGGWRMAFVNTDLVKRHLRATGCSDAAERALCGLLFRSVRSESDVRLVMVIVKADLTMMFSSAGSATDADRLAIAEMLYEYEEALQAYVSNPVLN